MSRLAACHWNPWNELAQIQRDVGRAFGAVAAPTAPVPAINVAQSEEGLLLTVELPGIEPDAVDVTVTSDTVTLRANPVPMELGAGETWYRRERSHDPLQRTIELPVEVDPERTEARYERGMLTLRLARPERQKPRKVTIKAG